MIQAAGEDGVDDIHHNRHDVNEVDRLGAQSLLVNDAVHLVYGRRVISLIKPAFFWLGFHGRDCNVIAEQGGGPDLPRGPEVAHPCSTRLSEMPN